MHMKNADLKQCRLDLASYIGAISRWCDLSGNVPILDLQHSKAEAELDAFNEYLAYLDQKKRRTTQLQF